MTNFDKVVNHKILHRFSIHCASIQARITALLRYNDQLSVKLTKLIDQKQGIIDRCQKALA